MKQKITEKVQILEGITCECSENILKCSKGSITIEKEFNTPRIFVAVQDNHVVFSAPRGNKVQKKIIKTFVAHTNNLFVGLNDKFVYQLEAANVHFPMTFKIEGNKFIINNFLGEKVSRKAKILADVDVDIKGQKITISSHDKESAGQTAANFEKATKVTKRDRRVFQDGIFITAKPRRVE